MNLSSTLASPAVLRTGLAISRMSIERGARVDETLCPGGYPEQQ